MKERESEFQTYFAIGKAFAEMVEHYHKIGEWDLEKFAKNMKEEYVTAGMEQEDIDNAMIILSDLYNNAQLVITERCDKSEYTSLLPIDDKYTLKCTYDALRDDIVEDYKTVTSFTKEDESLEKY